jgi:hypothetical protein
MKKMTEQNIKTQHNQYMLNHKRMRIIFITLLILLHSIAYYANPVDSIKAKVVAENYYIFLKPAAKELKVSKVNTKNYKGITTRYTFVFENNDFVIVSADDATVPVFGYSTKGNYNDTTYNANFEYWVQTEYDEWVYKVRQNNISNDKTLPMWNKIINKNFVKNKSEYEVNPLIQTEWGQSRTNDYNCPGYNYYVDDENSNCNCNKCTAGCVAVAMAQIMNYWRYPADDFDWCNMPNTLFKFDYSTSLPYYPYYEEREKYIIERNAIAELIADCGDKSEMNYCSHDCASGTTTSKAKNALKNDYDYSNDMILRHRWHTISWKNKLRNSLDNNQPIFYSGHKPEGGGHAFVCDGYKSGDYFHFNWGWNGYNDGDFYIKDNDGIPVIDYHKWQAAIFYIEPDGHSAYCCDDIKHISNTVEENNPFNSNFPFITWYGIPSYYNYFTYMATNIPPASEVIYQNGEPYLIYNDIKAGTIIADDVTIPEKTIVTFSAYDEVILTNFETSGYGEFVAQTIPCPYFDNSKTLPYSIIEDNVVRNSFSVNVNKISIYPNPFQNSFTLEISSDFGEDIQLQIVNMQGNVLQSDYINLSDDESVFTTNISAHKLKPGMYILRLISKTDAKTLRIIKQ